MPACYFSFEPSKKVFKFSRRNENINGFVAGVKFNWTKLDYDRQRLFFCG